MAAFKVYKDGNKDLFVLTDNYIFAESIAREESRNGHEMTISHDEKPVALFIGKYEIYSHARGYSIRKKGQYNRWEYLKSLYKGKAVFISDYTHGKDYKSLSTAKRAIESIL